MPTSQCAKQPAPYNANKPSELLTPREIEILEWTALGKTCFEIAILLTLSEETVRIHVKNCCKKLNASNKAHAVALALSCGAIKFHRHPNG